MTVLFTLIITKLSKFWAPIAIKADNNKVVNGNGIELDTEFA